MQIKSNRENDRLTIFISGRVDTVTAPELERYINENIGGVIELILDLKDMSYTSSAGLRVILKTQKAMNKQGSMKVVNVQDDVMEIFEMTGFSDILNIE
ncbi:MAG: STAS domain-containing protein [Clostridiales bacterium]|nr:STAS domain-containing protein [Clostridiales bacterium]